MKAKEKPKRSQRKAKVLPEFNLSPTTSASLLEAQLIAYYLREPPGETKNAKSYFLYVKIHFLQENAFSHTKSNFLEPEGPRNFSLEKL